MAKLPPENQEPAVSAARAIQEIRSRFNPLRGLTPKKVTRMIEEYDRGIFRESAWMMDKIERVDDMVSTVAGKRKKSVSRLSWAIRPYESWEEQGTEAQLAEQTRFLRHLYNNISGSHALERDTRGGLRLVIRQMADAIGKGYAVHNLQWIPRKDGLLELATTFTPLWFFESRTGNLKFLESWSAIDGKPLEPNAWMITQGDGIMLATLVAYIYKTLPLKDWLTYSERNGMPFISIATEAAEGSEAWYKALEAAGQVAAEYAAVHNRASEFQVHDLTAKGQLPYPGLVELMNRAIATLWRGADLSTMSGKDNLGASLQQDETDLLLDDDVEMINETFEYAISRFALRWKFGEDVVPLCYFALSSPDRLDEKAEQEKLHKAADYGVPIPVSDYRERLNIPGVEEDEEDALLTPPANTLASQPGQAPFAERANQALPETPGAATYKEKSLEKLIAARRQDLAPILDAVDQLATVQDPDEFTRRLEELRDSLEILFPDLDDSATAKAIEEMLGGAFATGAVNRLEPTET